MSNEKNTRIKVILRLNVEGINMDNQMHTITLHKCHSQDFLLILWLENTIHILTKYRPKTYLATNIEHLIRWPPSQQASPAAFHLTASWPRFSSHKISWPWFTGSYRVQQTWINCEWHIQICSSLRHVELVESQRLPADATNFVLPPPWHLWAWSLSPSSAPKNSTKKNRSYKIYLIRMDPSPLYKAYIHQIWSNIFKHISSLHLSQVLKPYKKHRCGGVLACEEKKQIPLWEPKKKHRTSTFERCCFFSSIWSDEKASAAK